MGSHQVSQNVFAESLQTQQPQKTLEALAETPEKNYINENYLPTHLNLSFAKYECL